MVDKFSILWYTSVYPKFSRLYRPARPGEGMIMALLWLPLVLLVLDLLVVVAAAESRPGFDRSQRGWYRLHLRR